MSIHAPHSVPAKPGSPFLAFLFLTAMAVAFLGAGLVCGVEPRLLLERTEARTFRATGSNHFAGLRFYTKYVEGVTGVVTGDAVRDRRGDSAHENQKRRRQKHLSLVGADGSRVGWDRETDARLIEDFMRGTEPVLSLTDKPPLWRMAVSWFLVGFGGLTLLGAIQSFFPKKQPAP